MLKIYSDLRKAVLYSKVTKAEFDLVKRAAPATLNLTRTVNGEEVLDFAVNYTGKGNVGAFGVNFDGVSGDGHLMLTIDIPETAKTVDEMKAFVADKMLPANINLGLVEANIVLKATEIQTAQANLAADIELG